jgi:hypothetical protein
MHQNFTNYLLFPCFPQEKRPFHMVNQKQRYYQLMPVSQGLIYILWCCTYKPYQISCPGYPVTFPGYLVAFFLFFCFYFFSHYIHNTNWHNLTHSHVFFHFFPFFLKTKNKNMKKHERVTYFFNVYYVYNEQKKRKKMLLDILEMLLDILNRISGKVCSEWSLTYE